LLPLKKGTQYEEIRSLGKHDKLVRLSTTPQSRKKQPELPLTIEASLTTRQVKGKQVNILSSLLDPMAYSSAEIVDLYAHKWEVELGYRVIKRYMLESRFTLRSNLPE
jgi:IS4 transposase